MLRSAGARREHSVPQTCTEERRQLEPELAFSGEFACAYAAEVLFFCASMTTLHLFYFLFGEYLLG